LNPIGVHEPVDTNIKCVCAAIERVDGGRDILRSLDFDCVDFESERAGRRLNLAQLQHAKGIADIAHDRQAAKAGDNLAQDFESLGSSKIRSEKLTHSCHII
jgi:hypothetical protein